MEKRIKDMTAGEYDKMVRDAERKPFSEFARFCQALSGYDLWYKGKQLDKWEAWVSGFKTPDHIILGKTNVKCFKKQTS